MITQYAHWMLELKACYIKIGKVGDSCLTIDSQHRQWAFDAIKATQAEIKQLKVKLALRAAPFTSLKYKP